MSPSRDPYDIAHQQLWDGMITALSSPEGGDALFELVANAEERAHREFISALQGVMHGSQSTKAIRAALDRIVNEHAQLHADKHAAAWASRNEPAKGSVWTRRWAGATTRFLGLITAWARA